MKRSVTAAVLLWRLFSAIARSGWQISWRILRPVPGLTPGFVEYRFEPMGPGAASMLACLICLTPGTTAVEVDPEAGSMRLHLLDAGSRDAALREIRDLFEDPVRRLFMKEDQA